MVRLRSCNKLKMEKLKLVVVASMTILLNGSVGTARKDLGKSIGAESGFI